MPREIIHIQVGQCGNQIGTSFWNTMRKEHCIKEDGIFEDEKKTKIEEEKDKQRLDKIDVYFKETGKKRFVPRAVLVDLEPGSLEVIKSSQIGKLFKQDNFAFGSSGAGNNWGKGYYTEGAELDEMVEEMIRHEAEACDSPQGFQITHSLGGGTGSGLGTLICTKLRDSFPDRLLVNYSVYPSPKVSDVVVEPYNAILSINVLLGNSDESFVIDNEALYNISNNILKQNQPKYADLNWIISLVMSGVTASLRFPGKLNGDLRKLGVNLVPFPRLHFFLVAHAPLFAPADVGKINLTVRESTSQMWSSQNFLANIKPEDGKYLCASCGFRGNLPASEVDDEISKIQTKMHDDFIPWIPNNIRSSIISVAPDGIPVTATFVANTTAIKGVFNRISTQFKKMFKRKAFLFWYKGEGMDEAEFRESEENVQDLISEYQTRQDAQIQNENENENENEDIEEQNEDVNDNACNGNEEQVDDL